MVFLGDELWFPSPQNASNEGLLAIGGDLSVERLLLAYRLGVFPWYNSGEPILWWSPNPRMVLFPDDLKVSKSMRKIMKSDTFRFTENENFDFVIDSCAKMDRSGQVGSWITPEMKNAYQELYEKGYAHSVEVWKGEKIVGGLYGVWIDSFFCGESMFSHVSNASKAGFINFVQKHKDKLKFIDCQVHTDHLESLGAKEISRKEFLKLIH